MIIIIMRLPENFEGSLRKKNSEKKEGIPKGIPGREEEQNKKSKRVNSMKNIDKGTDEGKWNNFSDAVKEIIKKDSSNIYRMLNP